MNPRSRQLARIKEQENKPTSVQKVLPWSLALLKPAMWGEGEGGGAEGGPGYNPKDVLSLSIRVQNVSFDESQRLAGRLLN